MAERTLNAVQFADFAASMGYARDAVVKAIVEDYDFAPADAEELVANAFRDADELDITNAHDEAAMCTCEAHPEAACAWHG